MSRVAPISSKDASIFIVDAPKKDEKKFPLFLSARLGVLILGFMASANIYTHSAGLSLGLVCMVNHTAVNSNLPPTTNATPNAHYGRCPARNGTSEDHADGEFVWSKDTQGMILGGYFWGYTLPPLIIGILAQKYSAKYVMLFCLTGATVASLLTPLAAQSGVAFLMIARIFSGFNLSAVSPVLRALWARWAPASERTVLVGSTYSGADAGTILAFSLSGELCAFAGWQSIFYVFGGLTALLCVAWFFVISDSPAVHPRIDPAERAYIERSARINKPLEISEIPWKSILTSGAVWSLIVGNWTSNFGIFLLVTEIPSFMSEVLRFDIKSNGLYSALPYIALLINANIGTVVADKLRKRISTGKVRKLMMAIGLCGQAGFMVATGYLSCDQTSLAVLFLTLSAGISGFKNSGYMVNHGEIAPQYAAILGGICNTFAGTAGFLAPMVTSFLTEDQTIDEWRRVFWVTAGICVFGAVFFALFSKDTVQEWAKEPEKEKTRF